MLMAGDGESNCSQCGVDVGDSADTSSVFSFVDFNLCAYSENHGAIVECGCGFGLSSKWLLHVLNRLCVGHRRCYASVAFCDSFVRRVTSSHWIKGDRSVSRLIGQMITNASRGVSSTWW